MEDERWLPVAGHEGLYEVSDLGRVRSWVRGARGRILKPQPQRDKSRRVVAWRVMLTGPTRLRKLHVLVLEAFVGQPPTPDHKGAHGDGQPGNNRLGNLRWATQKENCEDMAQHGTRRRGEDVAHLVKLTAEDIPVIRSSTLPTTVVAKAYGVAPYAIYAVRKRKTWKHI